MFSIRNYFRLNRTILSNSEVKLVKMEQEERKIKAVVYPNTNSPKLFKNKILEFLTKTHPLIIVGMYSVISYFLIEYYREQTGASLLKTTGLFLLGMFAWTLGEYLLHRFLYHKIGDATYDSGIQYIFHGIHHEYPNDISRTVLPPVPSLIIAGIIFGLFYLMMEIHAFVFGPGFIIGYSLYMMLHYTVHKRKPFKKWDFWWRHHNIHHFQQHDRAFGVSSSLWDHVFGTMPEEGRKTVDIITKRKSSKEQN